MFQLRTNKDVSDIIDPLYGSSQLIRQVHRQSVQDECVCLDEAA